MDRLAPALGMYKARLAEALKLIIRTCVMEYLQSFDPTLAVDLSDDIPESQEQQVSLSPPLRILLKRAVIDFTFATPHAPRLLAQNSPSWPVCAPCPTSTS